MNWFRRRERQSDVTPSDAPGGPLGYRFGSILIPAEEAVQHFAIIGSTGSGKTTLMRLLLQDVVPDVERGSDTRVLLYDAKQDALPMLAGIAPDVRVETLNPFDDRGVAWDIARDVVEPRVALEIAFTLIPVEQEQQPYFTNGARHLLYYVMLSFIRRQLPWSLADVLRAVSTPSLLTRVLRAHPFTRTLVSRYFGDRRTASNLISTIATKMLPFEAAVACWDAAPKRISLHEWTQQEYVLVLGNSEIGRSAIDALNRCIFKRASDLTLDQSESTSRRSWFFLDELSEAGKLNGLVSLAKKGRSKGACVCLAFQSIAGLRHPQLYGPELTAEILGQVGHRCFGRLECPETAEWASQLFGDQEIRQVTVSQSQGPSGSSTSHNEQFVTRRALLASEFMSLPPCERLRGLAAYYLSRSHGAFSATLDGRELFEEDLLPKADDVPEYVPRAIDAQYLTPWNAKQRKLFAPEPPSKKGKHKQPAKKTNSHPRSTKELLDGMDSI
jgi:type IV secretory pathway TraG/TraD family ATPase VirD4